MVEAKKLNVGIIGAGSISMKHLTHYSQNPNVNLIAISDLNEALAKERAEEYGLRYYATDYKALLADSSIDAVSVATPTFTHTRIVIDALRAGKHVLCEKPPALNAQEAEQCAEVAKETGKLLMYGLVCRFGTETQYLKEKVAQGIFGKILYAEASRVGRCSQLKGWFVDKSKAGGGMLDATIHEVDACLDLMGYPKPVSVLGYTNYVNRDLPQRVKGMVEYYQSSDVNTYERSVESMAAALVTFENGACLHIKSGAIMNSVNTGAFMDITAEKAGARFNRFGKELKMLELKEDGSFEEYIPSFPDRKVAFQEEIDHFVDCCLNGTPCIISPEQCVQLMKIMDACYKSAETGKPIIFE